MRLRRLPPEDDHPRALGLWSAASAAELQAALESLPLYRWMSVVTTQLAPHPHDPAATTAAPRRYLRGRTEWQAHSD